ncbi:MAG: hypothetical protein MZV49_09035 [Rhodopseudomonas palustris]|nr:hypothetical protein [Rhodopseudomonas palustris]
MHDTSWSRCRARWSSASAWRCSPTCRSSVKWPVRLGLLLPWALPLVFAGLIFALVLRVPSTGVVNDALMRLGVVEPLIVAVGRPTSAFAAICARRSSGRPRRFMALMLLAGLQTIPKSLYEAAEVDGASQVAAVLSRSRCRC